MRELFHLMKKDWRYVRVWAVAGWALTAAAWVLVDERAARSVVVPVPLLALLLPLVAVARLFQLDPALGTTAFWLTRPIDSTSLLASKLIVALGAVLGPCVLLAVAPLALRGLDLRPQHYALALVAVVVRYLFLTWFPLLVAVTARGLAQAILLAALLGLALSTVVHLVTRDGPLGGDYAPSFNAMAAVLLALQALAYVHVMYRTRRVAPALATLVITGAVIVSIGRGWRWDLMAPLRTSPPARPSGQRTDWPIAVHILGDHRLQFTAAPHHTIAVSATAHVEGLPEGTALLPIGYEASATMKSGAVESHQMTMRADGHVEPYATIPQLSRAILGCPRSDRPTLYAVRVFGTTDARPESDPSNIAAIRGRLRFAVIRAWAAQRARAKDGQLLFDGGRIAGAPTGGGDDAPALRLRFERLRLDPLPSPPVPKGPLFFDPDRGDCLSFSSSSYGGDVLPALSLESRERTYTGPSPMGAPARYFVGGRVSDATEMILLGHEVLGTLDVPFEYPGTASTRQLLRRIAN